MRALLVVVLLALTGASPATVPPYAVVHLSGSHEMPGDGTSCGAARRLLADSYLIHMWPGSATINRTPWSVKIAWDTGAILEHMAEPDAVTREYMFLRYGEPERRATAELTLHGTTESRAECTDRVRLDGYRLR